MVSVHRIAAASALTTIATKLMHATAADAGDSPSSVGASSFAWDDCAQHTPSVDTVAAAANSTLVSGSKAECAVIEVPLCYEGVCERKTNATIDLFVKRFTSKDTTSGKPNVIVLHGGSGAASTRLERIMDSISSHFNGEVNTYTMDQRGTGSSIKLECATARAGSVALDDVGECASALQAMYGGDLSPFSVTSAAQDVKFFIAKYLAGQETYVYGVGLGTLSVERLMHLNPVGVKGYILDGVMTTSGASPTEGYYLSELDVATDAVGKRFLSLCDDDKDHCGKFFPNTLATAMDEMLTKLESPTQDYDCPEYWKSSSDDPLVDTNSRARVRDVLAKLIQEPALRHLIPVLVYRISRCQDATSDGLVASYIVRASDRIEVSEEDSALVRDLIAYSELWASPSPSQSTLDERSRYIAFGHSPDLRKYCAFTKDDSAGCGSYHETYGNYAAAPIRYKRDKYYNVAASLPSDVSVLVLSGTLDPVTPHKYAETLYSVLHADKKLLVAFDYAAHGQLWRSDTNCTLDILRSYVAARGDLTKLNSSCAASTTNVSFTYDRETLRNVLHTDSEDGLNGAYHGDYDSHQYEAAAQWSWPPLMVVASVSAAAMVISVALVYNRLRAARRRKAVSTASSLSEPLV